MRNMRWRTFDGLLAALTLVVLTAAVPAAAQTPAEISTTSPSQTIGGTYGTVSVPVVIGRSDASPVLGFSVRVLLSSEFQALDTNTDVALGNFLTDGGRATDLQVIANGGGEYTIDGVTLGEDCGPTTGAGTLFTLGLRSSVASGTGTVTVESVTLRDCSNEPIAATPSGSPASVTIDNTAPSVALTAPNGGETWSYQTSHAITWSASDGAGITGIDLDYSTDGGSSWSPIATAESNDGTYTWAIPNVASANALVRVTAHDANGNSASDVSDVAFTLVTNTAPVLGAIGNQSASEGLALTFTATAADGESPPQSLTFSLQGTPPAGASIDANTGAFSWTPGETDGGSSPGVTVRVTDDGSPALFAEQTFTIDVAETNQVPALAIADQNATEGVELSVAAAATDADLPAQTLLYSLVSGPGVITTGGLYTWTPGETDGGAIHSVTVAVSDGIATTNASFAITVAEASTPPALAAIPDQAVDELVQLSVTAEGSDTDVPAQTLTYTLTTAPPGAGITGNVIAWTPTEAQGPGDYPFTVEVSDGAAIASRSFSVHVNEVNIAPVLSGVPASATITELVAYGFDADATDTDDPANTLTFSLVDGPAGASIDGSTGVFTWTPSESQGPGVHPFKVRVGDGAANTDADITLTVTDANSAPVLTGVPATAVTIPELVAYTFDADATDSDLPAQTLTFSLVGGPAGASIDGSTGVFTWTPSEDQGPSDYAFTVRVEDGATNTDASVSIHVDEANLAPVVTGVPATVTIPELVAYTFDADATDADIPAQSLAFSLVGGPAGAAIDGSTGVFTWTPTEAQGPGSYPFTVRASDGVASTDVAITITVDEVSIAAIADLAASIVRSGNDGDGTTKVLLTWSATPGGTTVEVYRARFGSYPEYDDAGGAAPAVPSYPPSAPWEAAAVSAPGGMDEVSNGPGGFAGRDYWTYVAFVHGSGANVSGPSNRPAAPNYLLGDVSDGTVGGLGRGDNVVDAGDISALGASYGLAGSAVTAVNYLDVGPTTDHAVTGRPLTDNTINFEDLVIFALDYGTGPAPQAIAAGPAGVAAKADRLVLGIPSRVAAGEEFTVTLRLEGTGQVQALSAALAWDEALVTPLGVSAGTWVTQLDGVALSPRPGVADVALLGTRESGFAGEGEVAVVRFRALQAGAPGVTVASVAARNAANRGVEVATSIAAQAPQVPTITMLAAPFPNPFRDGTMLELSVAQSGPVTVTVFGVDGRRVRTLADGRWEAGVYRLQWDGRDDAGHGTSAGVYFVQLSTAGGRFTRRITNLR